MIGAFSRLYSIVSVLFFLRRLRFSYYNFNSLISISLDPPGEIGQDCIKLMFNINDKCQLEVEGIDLRNNNKLKSQNLGEIR